MSTASISNDPNVLDASAIQFSRALQIAAQGHALWYPSLIDERGGVEGDCGYFDGGRFQAFFSVYEPPDDLELPSMPRPQGRDKIVDEILNQNDIIRSSDSCSIHVAANLQLPPLPQLPMLTIDMSAERADEEESAAFLAFCGPKRVEHRDPRIRGFENYLIEHGNSIVAHYSPLYPVDANNLVIIYQTTRCVSWWSGITYRRFSSTQGQFGAQVLGFGAAAHVEVNRAQNRPWMVMTRRGPESWEEQCQPHYSIIMRVVAMKKRSLMRRLARTLRIPAPHKSDGSRNSPEDKFRRAPAGPSGDKSFIPAPKSTASDHGAYHSATSFKSTHSSPGSEDYSSGLVAEEHDLLDQALENVLRDNPDVDVAVGNWNVVLECTSTGEGLEGLKAAQLSTSTPSLESTRHGVLGRLDVEISVTKSDEPISLSSSGHISVAGSADRPATEAHTGRQDTTNAKIGVSETKTLQSGPLPPIRTMFPGAFPPRSRTPAPPAPPSQGYYRTGPPPARSNTPGLIPPMRHGPPPVPPVHQRASTPASHMFTVMAPANGGGYATIARTTTEHPIGIIRRPQPEGVPVTAPREKRHVCNSCGAAFDLSGALENHTRTHTGEQPFACVYCPQTFVTNGNLRRHMRDQHHA